MLKILRKKGVAKKILWFIAIIIVLSFGVFGTANYLNYNANPVHAGKIFGRIVSTDEFRKNYLFTRNQAILRYGEDFNKVSQYLHLEAETWDRLILLQEAKKKRIKVTDQEVIDTIAQFQLFQRDGQFDPLLYNDLLRYIFKCNARSFEEGIRGSIMFNKLLESQVPPIFLTEEQLWEAFKNQNEKIQISYVLVSPDPYIGEVTVAEDATLAYFNEHKEEFTIPPTMNVEFIDINYPENASKDEKKAVDSKVEEIAQEIKSNPDLKTIGEKYNLAVQETGFFSKEQPNLKIGWSFELLNKAFSLSPDQFSEPMETPQGYCILKVKEKQDAHIPEFSVASDKVLEILKLDKAKEIAKLKTGEFLENMRLELTRDPSQNFSDLAQKLNLQIQQTAPFNHGQYVPNIGVAKEFQEAAFSLNEQNKLVGPVETPKGYSILHLDSVIPATREQFTQEKNSFNASLVEEMKNEVFNDYMARLRQQAKLEDNISKLKQ